MNNIDLITYPNMFCGVYVCTCTHICMSVYVWACGGAPAASPAILSSTITFLQDGVGLSLAWCLPLMLGGLLSNPWAFSFLCFPALGCQTVRRGNSLNSSGDEIQDLICAKQASYQLVQIPNFSYMFIIIVIIIIMSIYFIEVLWHTIYFIP